MSVPELILGIFGCVLVMVLFIAAGIMGWCQIQVHLCYWQMICDLMAAAGKAKMEQLEREQEQAGKLGL